MNLIFQFLLCSGLSLSLSVASAKSVSFHSSEEIITTLKGFPADRMTKDASFTASALLEIRRAVEFGKDHDLSVEAYQQILKTSADTLKHDPQSTAAEVLEPLYKKDPKLFKKNLQVLPEKQQKELLKEIELSEKESAQGNG
jgi:hypothetical protein